MTLGFFKDELRRWLLRSNREEHEDWKNLHHEELRSVVTAPKARKIRWTWHVARMIVMRDVCKFLVAKHNCDELRRTRIRRWEVDVESDMKEICVCACVRACLQGVVVDPCKHGYEISCCLRGRGYVTS